MATLFYDSFQNTNNWVGTSLVIKTDPIGQFAKVATFASNSITPSVFSQIIYSNIKSYTITFDYLGLPKSIAVAENLGGMVGVSDGGSMSDLSISYAGAIKNSFPPYNPNYLINSWGPYPYGQSCAFGDPCCNSYSSRTDSFVFLTDNQQWNHYSIGFSVNSGSVRIALGDYLCANYPDSGSAGDSYFANLLVTDSYGPSPFIATSSPENFRTISVDALNQFADTVSYINSNAAVTINLGGDYANGGFATGDILNDIKNIIGSSYNDVISGSASDNQLEGGNGNDSLTAGQGNDILIGGTGSDTFVIASEIISAKISDLEISIDKIDLRLFSGFYSLDNIQASSTYTNGNTIINLGSGKSLILQNINKADLTRETFILQDAPTATPTFNPTTLQPSTQPTPSPTTFQPSVQPTPAPTTLQPSALPSYSMSPSVVPTTSTPTFSPTANPTYSPTINPTCKPTDLPTQNPSAHPTNGPTQTPTASPSAQPSAEPTTLKPSYSPSFVPTPTPTAQPSVSPSNLYATIVEITIGGSYIGSSASENFIIDSALPVQITGNGGDDKFTIEPHQYVMYTITDFDPAKEFIDIRALKDQYNDLSMTLTHDNGLLITFKNSQTIKLNNVDSVSYGNFIYSNNPQKSASNNLSFGAIIGIVAGGVSCFCLTLGGFVYKYCFANKYNAVPNQHENVDVENENRATAPQIANAYPVASEVLRSKNPQKVSPQEITRTTDVNIQAVAVYDIKFYNPELQRVYDNRLGLGEAMKVLSDSANKNEVSTVKANEELPFVKDANPTIADYSEVSLLLSARNFIEAIPLIKYASQNIIYPLIESYLPQTLKNISYPCILDSKPALFTAHLATGITAAILMPAEFTKASVITSSASSAAFGARLTTSHYLAEVRQEKPVDVTESLKQCAVTVFAYTVPSLATCALAQTVMPGYQCQELDLWTKLSFAGSDCYAIYKSIQAQTVPSAEEIVVPYVVDAAAAVAAYANGYGLMGIVSSVVTADWVSKMALDFAKEVSFLGTEENFN